MSWFSDEGDDLAFGAYIERMESWQQAVADGRITAEEVRAQAERVISLLRDLEDRLDDELHELVTNVLLEYAVLQAIQELLALREPVAVGASTDGGAS